MMQRLETRMKTEQHTFPSKSYTEKENRFIYFFYVWEVEIKTALSINEFMVSETPLSPRKT